MDAVSPGQAACRGRTALKVSNPHPLLERPAMGRGRYLLAPEPRVCARLLAGDRMISPILYRGCDRHDPVVGRREAFTERSVYGVDLDGNDAGVRPGRVTRRPWRTCRCAT